MNSASEKILSQGLSDGFAGTAKSEDTQRGPFAMQANEILYDENVASYVDQWIGNRLAGGQEIAKAAAKRPQEYMPEESQSLKCWTSLALLSHKSSNISKRNYLF